MFRTPVLFRWIFPGRIWGFSRKENKVYLTFDDGPTEALTPWIVECLKQFDAKATFFCVGSNAQAHPELMELMVKHGHRVGNHTMHHERGTLTPKANYLESIEEASRHISSQLFRPPYGRLPMHYYPTIRRRYRVVMWTWLSYDYDASVSIDTILERANAIRPGDIIVLHDNLKMQNRIQELLPKLLLKLSEKGYRFEIISA